MKYESNIRVRIGGKTMNAFRFTDNIAFYAETKEDLQNILIKINKILRDNYGIK